MVTAALATAISKLITPPLYQTLADRYAAPGTAPAPSPSGVQITPGERQG
jgi:hypothetical protein